jgi:hypothetical protein
VRSRKYFCESTKSEHGADIFYGERYFLGVLCARERAETGGNHTNAERHGTMARIGRQSGSGASQAVPISEHAKANPVVSNLAVRSPYLPALTADEDASLSSQPRTTTKGACRSPSRLAKRRRVGAMAADKAA